MDRHLEDLIGTCREMEIILINKYVEIGELAQIKFILYELNNGDIEEVYRNYNQYLVMKYRGILDE